MKTEQVTLKYDVGTIVLKGLQDHHPILKAVDDILWDPRTLQFRAPAMAYREIVLWAREHGLPLDDQARHYEKFPAPLKKPLVPRPHQKMAIQAWEDHGYRGVVCLPTGAGKTILAVMAISRVSRPTLIVVPTIDLLQQWQEILESFLGREIGALGGGQKQILEVTVTTYDSASTYIESLGSRFGFLVFDECHHLPANHYQSIAKGSLAPFRLGLSATPERSDGRESVLFDLLGGLVYRGQIKEMVDKVLSPYDVVNIEVPLSDEEFAQYTEARQRYVGFLRSNSINMSSSHGWGQFLRLSSFRPGGQEALKAYRLQKKLAQGSHNKVLQLWEILMDHQEDRVLVFTNDNELAYRIGRELVLPVLTHQTKLSERKELLSCFRDGRINVLVTSKVLNEGVDVPEASVAIVVSGSSAVREHVQRLGRILRHRPGKRAILYEIVSKETSEVYANKRRRNHSAYQRSP